MTEQQQPPQGQPDVPPPGQPGGQSQVPPGTPVGGYGQPPGQMSPQDEKTWATLVHLSAFVAYVVAIPLLGPLIIYFVLRDRGPFIRHHATQAVNFQIIIIIAYLISVALWPVLIGIPLTIATAIVAIIFQIQAAVAANRGEWYRYPMTPDWVK